MSIEISEESYAVPAEEIESVLPQQEIFSFPCSDTCCRGYIKHAGQLIPVYDLHSLFSLSQSYHARESRIMIVRDARPFGLLVDQLYDMPEVSEDEILGCGTVEKIKNKKYVAAFLKTEKSLCAVLDVFRIREAVRGKSRDF